MNSPNTSTSHRRFVPMQGQQYEHARDPVSDLLDLAWPVFVMLTLGLAAKITHSVLAREASDAKNAKEDVLQDPRRVHGSSRPDTDTEWGDSKQRRVRAGRRRGSPDRSAVDKERVSPPPPALSEGSPKTARDVGVRLMDGVQVI